MLPADVRTLALLHRTRQQQLARIATSEALRLWRGITADVWASSARVVLQLTAMVTAAQSAAATGAQDYVATAVQLQGETPDPAGLVPPSSFAGTASDGRDLSDLLTWPVFQVTNYVADGMPFTQALGRGRNDLIRMVATQVQDAARISTGVAIANDRRTAGYIRVVAGGACSRCVVLAGRWYAYNAGFSRHPHCDCTQAPAIEHTAPQSPKALFDAMTPEQLKRAGWSDSDVRAINDGADLYQVTNAHRDLRSMSVAGRQIQTTLHGSTRRGLAGKRLGARKGSRATRLTPESIYAEAERLGWSRDETIRQLQRHGYIL